MKQRDQTYDLIRSLSKSEKRSFSLQSSLTSGSKNYMKVFEAMEKQSEYDNEALVKLAKKWKINLSYEKAYLQKQIIKMLRNVHFEGSHEMNVNQLLLDIDLLVTKKIYPLAEEQLHKARKLAENAELFPQLLAIQKWEHRLAIRTGNYRFQEQYSQQHLPREMEYLKAQENLLQYRGLQSDILGIVNKVGAAGNRSQALKKIIAHPLLEDESKALSFIAKTHFYEIRGICFTQLNDYKKAYENGRQMIALFEKHPEKTEINPQAYFAALSGLSTRCILLEKFDEAEACVKKLDGILEKRSPKENQNLSLEIKTVSYERRMLIHYFSGKYEQALALSRDMEKYIEENRKVLRKNFIAFHLLFSACTFFETGQHRESIRYIRNLLKEQREGIRLDYILSAHFLYFTLLYETDDPEHLSHLLKTTRKFFESQAAHFKCVQPIVACFAQLVTGKKNPVQKRKIFQETSQKLQQLYKVPAEKMLLENFDVIRWMSGKLRSL